MEVLEAFEFRFGEMVKSCGLVDLIKPYENNKGIMYAVEMTLREELRKLEMSKNDMLDIVDQILRDKADASVDKDLVNEAKNGNPYAQIYTMDFDEFKDPDKMNKFLYSEYPVFY